MSLKGINLLLMSMIGVSLVGCTTVTDDNRDPYEDYNRSMYDFNDSAYEYMRPLAKGYDAVMPDAAQRGLFNFFNNLRELGRVANDAMQGEWGYAGDDSKRFFINTTVGVLGFMDIADEWYGKQMRYNQSFAVTLHKWGVYDDGQKSPYIGWPILGPGTVEDLATGVDAMFNPLTYTFLIPGVGLAAYAVSSGTTAAYYANQGVSYLPAYDNLNEVSVDPYVAMRNAYLQNYDYGMAKVLKQELAQDKATLETDMAVLGVLGMDNANLTAQSASSGKTGSATSKEPMMLKSKLDNVNKANNIDEIYNTYYAAQSNAVDLNDLESGKATQPTDDLNAEIANAGEMLHESPKAEIAKESTAKSNKSLEELNITAKSIKKSGDTLEV